MTINDSKFIDQNKKNLKFRDKKLKLTKSSSTKTFDFEVQWLKLKLSENLKIRNYINDVWNQNRRQVVSFYIYY